MASKASGPSIAVITGASSGLGKAIYKDLVAKSHYHRVIGVARNGPDLCANLPDDVPLVREVVRRHAGRFELLINCAGILNLDEGNPADDQRVMDVNFWGPYLLIQELLGDLHAASGCVINVASISGMMADPDTPVYGASKAALISLTKSLAVKHAPRVRFNSISPGFFDTNLVPEPTPRELLEPVPLRGEGRPDEIIPVVRAIIESEYMTGSNIVIDGGLSCKAS